MDSLIAFAMLLDVLLQRKMTIINLREGQNCLPSADGLYTLCNFVIRKGQKIKSSSGKYLKIRRLKRWIPKQKTPMVSIDVSVTSKA